MNNIVNIINLNYDKFEKMNISFQNSKYYSIIGPNNSGKTTLINLIGGLISNESIYINNDKLTETYDKNIKNIFIVKNANEHSFLFKTVREEIIYILGTKPNKMVLELLDLLGVRKCYSKKISDLNYVTKQKLIFVLAMITNPKILLIDDVYSIFSYNEKNIIINYLLKKAKENNMVIIHFTTNLEDIKQADYVFVMDNFKIVKEGYSNIILEDIDFFINHNLSIPFVNDLCYKLKLYGLIDKNYDNIEKLVDALWK